MVVRTVDGQIVAFNAQTGEQKWNYRNRAVPLNLRVSSGMTFAGDAAVLAGLPGGCVRRRSICKRVTTYWQTPVSYPKGVTEVERINDVTGPPTLVGSETCAVTFQGQIGCFDANSGRALWEQGVLERERSRAGRSRASSHRTTGPSCPRSTLPPTRRRCGRTTS